MANTRNNPLEDLAVHLPMICDRYEMLDNVMPAESLERDPGTVAAGRYGRRHHRIFVIYNA